MKTNLLVILFIVAGAVACKDKSGDGTSSSKTAELDPESSYMLNTTRDRIKEAKQSIEAGKPADAFIGCAAALAIVDDVAAVKQEGADALANELKQVCSFDVPFAAAQREVARAEAARKAKGEREVVSECFNATFETAIEDLTKAHAGDARVKGLSERFLQACPKDD